jgi:hypothetical protein
MLHGKSITTGLATILLTIVTAWVTSVYAADSKLERESRDLATKIAILDKQLAVLDSKVDLLLAERGIFLPKPKPPQD